MLGPGPFLDGSNRGEGPLHVITRRCVVALVCALTAMLVAAPAQAAPIPPPKQYFGFELGTTGKLARFSKIQQYLKLIGDNSNRVDYLNLGKTTNGHDMPLLQSICDHMVALELGAPIASGRPADVLVAPDGSLLIADDWAGAIYRISYAR